MEEQTFMVCMRVDELDDPVEGSTSTACVECGADIWISVESRKVMHKEGAMPLCSKCALRLAEETPEVAKELGAPSEGQLGELMARLEGAGPLPEFVGPDGEKLDAFEGLKQAGHGAANEMTRPDEDWGAFAYMENYDGVIYPPIPLQRMLNAGVPKKLIAHQLVPAMAHAAGARRVIFGMSTWALVPEEGQEGLHPDALTGPISEHPDRVEMLVLIDVTADGVQQMSSAFITRSKTDPPTLGEWKDSKDPAQSEGLFVDALIPALALIRTLRESSST